MCVCAVRDHEGRNSPGRRRRRQHNKSSESSSSSPSIVNHSTANTSSDKENVQLNNTDNVDGNYDGDDDDTAADVKADREIKELAKMTDSGAAKVILEDLRKKKLEKRSLDPRSSSRTPSATAEPHYSPRYDSPIFACECHSHSIHRLAPVQTYTVDIFVIYV